MAGGSYTLYGGKAQALADYATLERIHGELTHRRQVRDRLWGVTESNRRPAD
jgi:hypothetical protein